MPSNCDQCVSCKQIPAVEKPLLINIHEDDPSSTYICQQSYCAIIINLFHKYDFFGQKLIL